ncbi:MAG TPA: hypothetical protein VGK29_09950 [Paludibaculum sp.]|jgi:hypothetical protein
MTRKTAIAILFSGLLFVAAQTAANKPIMGTITGFKSDTAEIQVKPDEGDAAFVRCGADTMVQRVAPGEKDLKKAAPIQVTDLAMGDRVLVSFVTGSTDARRIIVMAANEIAKAKEADKQDWQKRGLSGVVTAIKGNDITLRSRSMAGEIVSTVTVGQKTLFRRYSPDSVRFADAKISILADVKLGDQMRGRGEKSADGLKVAADEVVFGTFLTKAGAITTIDPSAGEVTVKELESGKPLLIRVTAESQVKRMPSFGGGMPGGGMPGGGRPGGMPGGAGPGGGMAATGGRPGGMPGSGPGGGMPGGMGMRPGGAPDMAQMLERIPLSKISDLKVGETIVVSSTRGASNRQVTAIMLLGNADTLIQMASATQARSAQGGLSLNGGGGMGGMTGGMGGLELPGMMQ